MKMVVAFINPENLWEVKRKLLEINAPGISVVHAMGIGKPLARFQQMMEKYGAVPKFFPKMRIEIVAPDDMVSSIIDAIKSVCHTGNPGDGKIFVLNVDDAVRIRTGESGEDALK